MSDAKLRARLGAGPFRPEHVRPGDAYEVSNGHAIQCAPTGGDGTGPNGRGFMVLDSDPMVKQAGVDTGLELGVFTLRAPDVAVGDFPEAPGWVNAVPPLAVEYAAAGQDEDELREKIDDLLRVGTRHLWVVRLTGPRRVEVYEPGKPMRTALPGQALTAPGVLQNPVPVEALYDREAAHEVALQNLLQRRGYRDLDAVRDEGQFEGRFELAAHQFERRLRRPLGEAERATLRARIASLGAARVGDVVLDLDGAALARWLADPDAR